jgi:magnesium transporter
MLLDLKFSIGTLGLAMGTFMAGLYGMNLENFIEETNWGFAGVTGVSVVFSLFVCWYGLVKLRKVQRIKMMIDERGSFQRNPAHLRLADQLDARNREKVNRLNLQKAMQKQRKFLP